PGLLRAPPGGVRRGRHHPHLQTARPHAARVRDRRRRDHLPPGALPDRLHPPLRAGPAPRAAGADRDHGRRRRPRDPQPAGLHQGRGAVCPEGPRGNPGEGGREGVPEAPRRRGRPPQRRARGVPHVRPADGSPEAGRLARGLPARPPPAPRGLVPAVGPGRHVVRCRPPRGPRRRPAPHDGGDERDPERGRGDAGGRHADDPDERRRERAPELGGDRDRAHGARHRARRRRADLPALLHHEDEGDGARPRHRAARPRGPRRRHHGGKSRAARVQVYVPPAASDSIIIEMPKVLVVDDEPAMVKVLSGFLAQEKIPCVTASSGEAALKVLHADDIGVIVTDLKMTGMDGLQLLEHALNIDRSLQVILMTAHGTSEIGQRAWELGAAGYVRKPFDRDEILFEVRRALDRVQAGGEVSENPSEMVGQSAPMKDVYALVARVAPTSSTVLIRGESGTGKELVARAVHDQSKRKGKPFIKVICAALPETLIESELFGYDKGAFTGAAASKPGRFELAEGGTIFLDEIGDLTPATQVKLLRVLQDRQFERLGGTQTLRADVRVLAATHRDLEALVREGKFREDLFYRINV